MIKHLCFTDHRMTDSAEKCYKSALKFGCNSSTIYSPMNIDSQFNFDYQNILSQDRGAGYWLWKPYFIKRVLDSSKEGDIIVYTDAGVEFVNDVNYLIDEMSQTIMVFGNGHRHGKWCKGDVLTGMNCWEYKNHDQAQASCIILINGEDTRRFVNEWLEWCCKDGFIDDSKSELPNDANFIEHRHDQAILTNMCYLWGVRFNRWPAQYNLVGNEKYNNKYPQIFNHHGKRNDGSR